MWLVVGYWKTKEWKPELRNNLITRNENALNLADMARAKGIHLHNFSLGLGLETRLVWDSIHVSTFFLPEL